MNRVQTVRQATLKGQSEGKEHISQDGAVRLLTPCPFAPYSIMTLHGYVTAEVAYTLHTCITRYSPGHGLLCGINCNELHHERILAAAASGLHWSDLKELR